METGIVILGLLSGSDDSGSKANTSSYFTAPLWFSGEFSASKQSVLGFTCVPLGLSGFFEL